MYWKVLSITTTISWLALLNVVTSIKTATESNERFALKLSTSVALERPQVNVIVAPLQLQIGLALLYFGASDDVAHVLRSPLQLQSFATPETALRALHELANSIKLAALTPIHYNSISGFYTQERYTYNFKDEFIFKAERVSVLTQRLDFDESAKALDQINFAFLIRTNYTIGEVVNSQMLHDESTFLFVSATIFKAPWAQAFEVKETEKLNFHTDFRNHKLVDMMFVSHKFKYAEFPNLDAKAVELPYEKTNLKLLIILPNKIDGLIALEEKLKHESLATLVHEMSEQKIALTLPKFRLEERIELKTALEQTGFSSLFQSGVSLPKIFSSLLSSSAPHLSAVPHKVIFEIDEKGGNADSGFSFGDIFKRTTQVLVDHPFYFAVRSDDALLLTGHIVNI